MSDTPRTDSAVVNKAEINHPRNYYWWVHADFSRQLERELNEARKDKERLDWLEHYVVEVRKPASYGSHAYFFAQETSDQCEPYQNNIRQAIDAAMQEKGKE